MNPIKKLSTISKVIKKKGIRLFKILYLSDPNSVDGDSDGYTDVEEVAAGRDPSDATNFPNEAPVIADQEFKLTEGLIDVAAVLATDTNKEDTLSYTVANFSVVEGDFTWDEAKADAVAKGGRLAVLNTSEVLAFHSLIGM